MRVSTPNTLESMIRALRVNYCHWLAGGKLTEDEHAELVKAADEGNAMGFIMRPVCASHLRGDSIQAKIHSNLYH